VTAVSESVARAYLLVDLDSIDALEAHANQYAASGGPGLQRLLDCIPLTGEHLTIVAAAITAYDPEYDADDRTLKAARAVARQIVRAIPAQPRPATG
jgi:arginase